MTRHGTVHTVAAGARPPATNPHASVPTIAATTIERSRVSGRQHRAAAQQSHQSASIAALPSADLASADIGHRSKSP